MGRKVLTREAAFAAKRMYDEVDEWGRHKHSIMSIAAFLAVSETTIFRVVHNFGAYMSIPKPPTENELVEGADKSLASLLADPEFRSLVKTEGGAELPPITAAPQKEAVAVERRLAYKHEMQNFALGNPLPPGVDPNPEFADPEEMGE